MTSSVNFNNSYYLEINPESEDCSRSIVSAIKIMPNENTSQEWGYLIYQDSVEDRQRIIPIAKLPASSVEKYIDCTSISGERFCFSYIDYALWLSKVRNYAQVPQEVSKKLTTTEAVQAFFKL